MANERHARLFNDLLLSPEEILRARLDLNLTQKAFAEALLLSPRSGPARVSDWEQGRIPITGPASQAIRLWLAIKGKGPVPRMPFEAPKPGVSRYRDPDLPVTPEMIAAGLDALYLIDPDDSYEVVASLLTEIFTKMSKASEIRQKS